MGCGEADRSAGYHVVGAHHTRAVLAARKRYRASLGHLPVLEC